MFILHIAIVDTRDGSKSFYGLSEADLRTKLATYCREQWEYEEVEDPIPEDDEDVIDEFFDNVSLQFIYMQESFAMPEIENLLKAANQILVDASSNQNSGIVKDFENHWQILSNSLREIEKHYNPQAWLPNKES
jgi:hypothetical protein